MQVQPFTMDVLFRHTEAVYIVRSLVYDLRIHDVGLVMTVGH